MVFKIKHFEAVDVFLALFFVYKASVVACIWNEYFFGSTQEGISKSIYYCLEAKKPTAQLSFSLAFVCFYEHSWRTTVAALPLLEQRDTEVRILYHWPAVMQRIRCQVMAGPGISRHGLNRAFSHLGWEQHLQVLLEISQWPPSPTNPCVANGWRYSGCPRSLFALQMSSRRLI